MKKRYIIIQLATVAASVIISVLQLCKTSASEFPYYPAKTVEAAESNDVARYIISIYYIPERENDAAKVKEMLEALGYTVNRLAADPDLEKRVKGRPSYIYFQENDFDAMIRLRRELSILLKEDFNVFRSVAMNRADKDMRVILAGK